MAAAAAELAGAPSGFQDVMRTPGAPAAQGGVTRGFGFVATPSPAPGVDESPFITWGRMDATPVRLDPMETPVDIGGREGTAFTMKPQRARGAQTPLGAPRAREFPQGSAKRIVRFVLAYVAGRGCGFE